MRKNILILGHSYGTQFIDIYNQYARVFDSNKYCITVAFLTGKPDEEVKKRIMADKTLFLNIPKKHIRALKILAIRKLFLLTRENQYQMVICHRYKPTYIMMWVAQFYPIPAAIFVMHELNTMTALSRKFLIKHLHRKNMVYAGVSNAVRDDMRKSLRGMDKERIITLYNMIDADLTEPQFYSCMEARKALNLHENDFVFGNLARLAPNKDQKTLIEAFSLIKSDCPHAKLVIMGEGQLEKALKEQAAAYQLTDSIIFTGFLAQGFRYMKAFNSFVLCSIQEAFGRVLLEAMLAKVPVIASRVHGIPEVLGQTGKIIPPRDVDALACAMKESYSLSFEARKALAEKAYQHTLSQFTIPQFHAHFWQLPLVQGIKD